MEYHKDALVLGIKEKFWTKNLKNSVHLSHIRDGEGKAQAVENEIQPDQITDICRIFYIISAGTPYCHVNLCMRIFNTNNGKIMFHAELN
jgi:hypothetical protein